MIRITQGAGEVMTDLQATATRLTEYNAWRRGGDGDRASAYQIGCDIDDAIAAIQAVIEHNAQCTCNTGCTLRKYYPDGCPDCPEQWKINIVG